MFTSLTLKENRWRFEGLDTWRARFDVVIEPNYIFYWKHKNNT